MVMRIAFPPWIAASFRRRTVTAVEFCMADAIQLEEKTEQARKKTPDAAARRPQKSAQEREISAVLNACCKQRIESVDAGQRTLEKNRRGSLLRLGEGAREPQANCEGQRLAADRTPRYMDDELRDARTNWNRRVATGIADEIRS